MTRGCVMGPHKSAQFKCKSSHSKGCRQRSSSCSLQRVQEVSEQPAQMQSCTLQAVLRCCPGCPRKARSRLHSCMWRAWPRSQDSAPRRQILSKSSQPRRRLFCSAAYQSASLAEAAGFGPADMEGPNVSNLVVGRLRFGSPGVGGWGARLFMEQ